VTVSIAPSSSRRELVAWYRRNRQRSRGLFDLIDPDVYFTRPIALRNPIVFYEGHLPAFSVISFLKRGLGHPGVDDRLEVLFARGIDPDSEQEAVPRSGAGTRWPSRPAILDYARAVDDEIVAAIERAEFDVNGREHAAMADGEAIFTALEHEAMHQETLLYMWRRLPYTHKHKPRDVAYELGGAPPAQRRIDIPAGRATLGARRPSARAQGGAGEVIDFGWDNEFDAFAVEVPGFDIDAHSVTNADFLAFIADRGYQRRELWDDASWEWREAEKVVHPAFWSRAGEGDDAGAWAWRGMFEEIPLPPAWPVYVSQAEAAAFARWKGRRLPTEAEYHRAAYGTPDGSERAFPWGSAAPQPSHGNFDFESWEPVPAGARPAGVSAWGVHDLVGNGWEWTATEFAPFAGFVAMASYPEYSAEFFDGRHVVLKGASPATAKELIRRSFRNWFRTNYPYVYSKFRTVSA
jgi:ergothioneine biosynthesis protein EgtB